MRAISSTQRSTADSIPRPSRSSLSKPASAHESLSHCTIWRPSMAAGWIGHMSISGWVEMTMPPECWDWWRGSPAASRASSTSAAQRGEPPREAWAPATSPAMSLPGCHGSTVRARRSISPPGSPSALAKSRTADLTW